KIILASKSIDRSELLKKAGIPFEKIVTNIDEEKYKAKYSHGNDLVKELAKAKALFAKNKLIKSELNALIVAADTLVILEGEIIRLGSNIIIKAPISAKKRIDVKNHRKLNEFRLKVGE
ncbi:unnamed protein product, partial [marine sediment metagenome]